MYVDTNRAYRASLSDEQKAFLKALIPLVRFTSLQIYSKCLDGDPPKWTSNGISPSLLAAHCIYKSDWGRHPVAQRRFALPNGSTDYGNNLALLKESGDSFNRKIAYSSELYGSYKDHHDFSTEWSNRFAWTEDYAEVLRQVTLPRQLKLLSLREVDQEGYLKSVSSLILNYKLHEFDG